MLKKQHLERSESLISDGHNHPFALLTLSILPTVWLQSCLLSLLVRRAQGNYLCNQRFPQLSKLLNELPPITTREQAASAHDSAACPKQSARGHCTPAAAGSIRCCPLLYLPPSALKAPSRVLAWRGGGCYRCLWDWRTSGCRFFLCQPLSGAGVFPTSAAQRARALTAPYFLTLSISVTCSGNGTGTIQMHVISNSPQRRGS